MDCLGIHIRARVTSRQRVRTVDAGAAARLKLHSVAANGGRLGWQTGIRHHLNAKGMQAVPHGMMMVFYTDIRLGGGGRDDK